MSHQPFGWNKLAVLIAIVERLPGICCYSLAQLCYLLQTVCAVPLGYRFSLCTTGPEDREVLADLRYLEHLDGIVESSGGRVYPGGRSIEIAKNGQEFSGKYKDKIDWLADVFGRFTLHDLSLLGTIVYVDRAEDFSFEGLVYRVHTLRPSIPRDTVERLVLYLYDLGLLRSRRMDTKSLIEEKKRLEQNQPDLARSYSEFLTSFEKFRREFEKYRAAIENAGVPGESREAARKLRAP